MTAPLVTPSRDALAEGLCGSAQVCTHSRPTRWCERTADALLASGVVRAADTLADDEALVDAAMRGAWSGDPYKSDRTLVQQALRALAAALESR